MMKLLVAVTVGLLMAGPAWASEVLLVVVKGQQRVPICRSAQARA